MIVRRMTQQETRAVAMEMGLRPENVIGTREHRAKWLGKLAAAGFDGRAARMVFRQALEARQLFGSFPDAVKAFAGAEDGVRSAPRPGRKAKWDG